MIEIIIVDTNIWEVETYCADCDDYMLCSGIPCSEHPIVCAFKKDPIFTELDDALYSGRMWGDILCDEEENRLINRTEEEIKRDTNKKNVEDARHQSSLRQYVLDKTRRHHCEQKDGKWMLKHKFNVKCTDFHLAGGCWAHDEGICRFIHPGEEIKFEFNGSKVIKLIEGTAPKTFKSNNVTWFSSKAPYQKKPKETVDSW